MSIFRRDSVSSSPAPAGGAPESSGPAQRRRLTHIAAGTRLTGEVTGGTELLVEGELRGEVRVEAMVTVGAEGLVEGPITAPVVRVGGRVVGAVVASDRVEVSPAGSLEGDISAPRVVIAEGAFFKGRVEMRGDNAPAARGSRGTGEPEPKEPKEAKRAAPPGKADPARNSGETMAKPAGT
jgi:cytoskeletal protein CcmA (bactofilin family)